MPNAMLNRNAKNVVMSLVLVGVAAAAPTGFVPPERLVVTVGDRAALVANSEDVAAHQPADERTTIDLAVVLARGHPVVLDRALNELVDVANHIMDSPRAYTLGHRARGLQHVVPPVPPPPARALAAPPLPPPTPT